MKLSNLAKSFVLVAAVSASSLSFAVDIDHNADDNDIAIGGYDTVAYFTKGEPVQGSEKYMATYKNAIYQFSSKKNRNLFRENPEKYAPQFGGFCAMGVSLEKKFDVDPLAFKIIDQKLYLNLNKKVQKSWLNDTSGNIVKADENWDGIKNKSPKEL